MLSPTLPMLVALAVGVAQAQDTSPCDYKLFTQSVDHFGAHNGTFQQRYSFFDEFYKPGGPILLFQGEEGNGDCANTTVMYHFAQELNGLAVSLEHRFFGESLPFGPNASWTVDNFKKYLTLDNVQQDAVSFGEYLKNTVPGAKDSKYIVASGSYGGTLATTFRQSHPDTFFAAIASAGAVLAMSRDQNDPYAHNWWNYVSQAYRDKSYEASVRIEKGFDYLHQKTSSGDFSGLKEALNICTEPTNTTSRLLTSTLQQVFNAAVEFNYPRPRPGRGPPLAFPFEVMIQATLNADDSHPLNAIHDAVWLAYGSFPDAPKCLDISSPTFIVNHTAPGIQAVPFIYIGCTYVPLDTGSMGTNGIFPAFDAVSTEQAVCQQRYGKLPMTQDEIWSRYKISPDDLANSTQIIFSLAQHDPTTALSPQVMPPSDNKCQSRRLLTSQMAHREDLYYPDPTDLPTVIMHRNMELQILKQWLDFCE